MRNEFQTHSLPRRLPDEWQWLEEHLENVTEMAAKITQALYSDTCALLNSFILTMRHAVSRWLFKKAFILRIALKVVRQDLK